ncbi:GDSL-type esterase/lipase family protein [Brevibacillus sp. H7]|uniref:GDSL-type esterase/lipase family protein n=1 Tax=Brevibacillus sp. H7 TaxID=3349138 RepID=UPI0037F5E526
MRFSGLLLWRTTGLLALISFLLFAGGFVFAVDPQQLSPRKPLPEERKAEERGVPLPADGKWNVVTLGDSLTRGVGDANGQGYVGLVREALEKQTGQPSVLTNLAISGLQSPGLLEQLSQTQVKRQLAEANLILFTIGGNDLFHQSGGVYTIDQKKLAEATMTLSANFEQILQRIRALNPKATIVYTALYNPFGDTEAAVDTIKPVLEWNSTASEIAAKYRGVIVVPTYDLFFQKEKTYLYTDHFHPNSEGYARIAERVMQALQ